MKNNNAIEQINEGAVNQIYEEVSTSNGNPLVKIALGVLVVAAGVGTAVWFKNRKNRKQECEEVSVEKETKRK